MKISFEQNQFQMSSLGSDNNHWLLNFDNGVVQKDLLDLLFLTKTEEWLDSCMVIKTIILI